MHLNSREVLVPFYELFVGPAQHILDRWFESDILKTTLATDAVIGKTRLDGFIIDELFMYFCLST